MPEKVMPGPVQEGASIREAVRIHTRKIFDSCKEEDIAFYKLYVQLVHPELDLNARENQIIHHIGFLEAIVEEKINYCII